MERPTQIAHQISFRLHCRQTSPNNDTQCFVLFGCAACSLPWQQAGPMQFLSEASYLWNDPRINHSITVREYDNIDYYSVYAVL